jgi:hypothetical protein
MAHLNHQKSAPEMNIEPILGFVPLFALLISAASLVVSFLAYRRAGAAEKPIVWVELASSPRPDWFIGTIFIRNPSGKMLQAEKLMITPPEFYLSDYAKALQTEPNGERALPRDFDVGGLFIAMPCNFNVGPGSTSSFTFLIYKALFSRALKTEVRVMIHTKEASPKTRIIRAVVRFRYL